MRSLIFFILLLPLAAGAANKKINLKPQPSKLEDPGSATHLIYEAPKASDTKVEENGAVKPTCRDSVGMVYKKGDKGYEGCFRTMDLSQPQDKRHSPSVGFSIGQ